MSAKEAYPRREGIPHRPPLLWKASDGILSLELAHNLPHSLCQGWYIGLISSLIRYGAGYAYLHGEPGDSRSGFLSADRVLVSCLCAHQ